MTLAVACAASHAFTQPVDPLPAQFDVRGTYGVPQGLSMVKPRPDQLKAVEALRNRAGNKLEVRYNGLTATPRHLFRPGGYLSEPRAGAPEAIARAFLRENRGLYRFSDEDLASLRLRSRATLPDSQTTIVVLEQQVAGIPVYQGDVLVTISRNGRVLSVGNDSFPQLRIANEWRIGPEEAIGTAAADLGMPGLFARYLGTRPVLNRYGDLAPGHDDWPVFDGGLFGGEIVVKSTVFPMGASARYAYEFILETPHHYGMMWQNIVDAETGRILRRISLTSFQQGGGDGIGRRASFRPDVQDMVESWNGARTARGKVFDAYPTQLSGRLGHGRSTRAGTAPDYVYAQPIYAPESVTDANAGRGFKYAQQSGRHEAGLPFGTPAAPETFTHAELPLKLGTVDRGFPDAENPSLQSPFGWFYLPTDNGGVEVTAGDANRAMTRALGYSMATEARGRNLPENSPGGDGDQPYSATVTALGAPVTLADGRTLGSVLQSNYTEGNNVLVADDHGNDNESTHGIKGYSATRTFDVARFDYVNGYEYGGVNAGGTPFYPPTIYPDVYPATVSLFYLNNVMHDYLYSIGFTESLWNFQQDNFGKGGAANDAVSAQAMDGSGTNNANFGTPADGARPRMQMYVWTEAATRRTDGDFDFDVIAHELFHGVSNRSAGKGSTGCLGLTAVGESGGQGEGWSDYIANSMADDDTTGEYVTGELDRGIRRLPHTNYRWSYAAINRRFLTRRDRVLPPDPYTTVSTSLGGALFAVHPTGEIWAATLWDMRELLIMRDPVGVFYDGNRRLGPGTTFYVGNRPLQSVDALHPIDYRAAFRTSNDPLTGGDGVAANVKGDEHFIRPRLLAAEIAARGDRAGPLATAVAKGARMADTLMLRGLQLSPCNPSFVDSRDSILAADTELNGGENRAIIWRAFASHGVGVDAASSGGGGDDQATQSAPAVVEDFKVPAAVAQCETLGPLPNPAFTLSNTVANTVTITINGGVPIAGANNYAISRANSADGPFAPVATLPAATTTFDDDDGGTGLPLNGTFYYKVRAARDAGSDCVSTADTHQITVTVGIVLPVNPLFGGLDQVGNPQACDRLVLSWNPASSTNVGAQLVYDIFRVPSVTPGDGTQDPSFTPADGNRIQQGLLGTSFADTGLTLSQPYYYIVRARDADTGRIDTSNTGNLQVRFNAPTSTELGTPLFALEDFETAAANNRFAPPLTNSATRDQALAAWQRVPGLDMGGDPDNTAMYAPDFDPAGDGTGGNSDFSAVIGPLTLAAGSILEFDSRFNTETAFDGGTIELALGGPNFNATPFPDNSTTFDLGNYMIAGGYNGKLDGTLAGPAFLSPLQGRRAFTGSRGPTHTRIVLGAFAPGGAHNAAGAPVYIRFRMTSDVGTDAGPGSGWIVDNVVINNQLPCPVDDLPIASAGPDFAINEGQTAMWTGSATGGSGVFTYRWTQTGGPGVALNDANAATPNFTAPSVTADTPLTFELTVTDEHGQASAPDSIVITVKDVTRPAGPAIGNNQVGGAMTALSLILLGLAGLRRRRLSRSS